MKNKNNAIKGRLTKVQTTVNKLSNIGLTVLDVKLGLLTPVISIEPPKKKQIKGETYLITSNANGIRSELMVGNFQGCRVQWQQST